MKRILATIPSSKIYPTQDQDAKKPKESGEYTWDGVAICTCCMGSDIFRVPFFRQNINSGCHFL